jgi:hypothetical protein
MIDPTRKGRRGFPTFEQCHRNARLRNQLAALFDHAAVNAP